MSRSREHCNNPRPAAAHIQRAFVLLERSILLLVVLPWLSSGCKSASQFISPRIEGRVLDATSHQPVERVRIARVNASQRVDVDEPAKGGQLMTPSDAVFTASDGTFKLESLKDVALFSHIGWYSVTLSFQHSAYRPFQATYTITEATNNASGVPVVHAGDVLLAPNNH